MKNNNGGDVVTLQVTGAEYASARYSSYGISSCERHASSPRSSLRIDIETINERCWCRPEIRYTCEVSAPRVIDRSLLLWVGTSNFQVRLKYLGSTNQVQGIVLLKRFKYFADNLPLVQYQSRGNSRGGAARN